MRRALVFILLTALVVAVAVWFADRPGAIQIAWGGWRVDTSVAILVALVAGFALVLVVLLRLLGWVVSVPRSWRRLFVERRRRRGYQALTQGMVAVAAGDAEEAWRHARRADGLLDEPPLTMLLAAQAAQLNGDEDAARRYFTAMLDRPETAFLGLRGLLMQALRAGDNPAALDLARRARRMRPDTPWVMRTLLELEERAGLWRDAEVTLADAIRRRALPAGDGKHRRAVVLLERSRAAETEGLAMEALDLAGQAHGADPALVPATERYVRLLQQAGRGRKAERVAEKAWAAAPHPAIARAHAALGTAEPPLDRVRRAERLAATLPDHPESRLAVAEAALAAELWGEARRQLDAVVETQPSSRAYRLLAELEEREKGDADAARDWLMKATDAPAGERWVCERCATPSDDWAAFCPSCGAWDSLAWRVSGRVLPLRLEGPAAA